LEEFADVLQVEPGRSNLIEQG